MVLLWEPTPWAIAFIAFVGAHPVGDGFALAVCVQSPAGVGSYKQPSGLLSLWEPTPWAISLHGADL
jgi:hypothetical protein